MDASRRLSSLKTEPPLSVDTKNRHDGHAPIGMKAFCAPRKARKDQHGEGRLPHLYRQRYPLVIPTQVWYFLIPV